MAIPNLPMSKEGNINAPDFNVDDHSLNLLDDIKKSIMDMQNQMQQTYVNLGELKISGFSHDRTIEIIMTATYQFVDININPKAFANAEGKFSQKEFTWRLREAWTDLSKRIQETTQQKTIELLQGMHIPDEIKNLNLETPDQDENQGD